MSKWFNVYLEEDGGADHHYVNDLLDLIGVVPLKYLENYRELLCRIYFDNSVEISRFGELEMYLQKRLRRNRGYNGPVD